MTEETLDARGLACPLPVLKARKRLLSAVEPMKLTVLVDAGNDKDLRLFCAEQGYACTVEARADGTLAVVILRHSLSS